MSYERLVVNKENDPNNLIRDSRENEGLGQTFYPSLTPQDRRTERLIVRSNARNILTYPNSGKFTIRLNSPLKNVVKISCTGGMFFGAQAALAIVSPCLLLRLDEFRNYEDASSDSLFDTTFPLVIQGFGGNVLYLNNQVHRHSVELSAPTDRINHLTVSLIDPATGLYVEHGAAVDFALFLEVTSLVSK